MGCGEGAELALYSLFSTIERVCNQLYNGNFTFFFSAAHERLLFRHVSVASAIFRCLRTPARLQVVVVVDKRSVTVVTGKIKRLVPNQTPSAVCKRSIY
jgi:hypothetical protein